MLVYDITNDKSFENIKNWIRNIEEVSMFLVTNFILNRRFVLQSVFGSTEKTDLPVFGSEVSMRRFS